MPKFKTGDAIYRRGDGSTYSVPSRTFTASNFAEAEKKQREFKKQEENRHGSHFAAGHSVKEIKN